VTELGSTPAPAPQAATDENPPPAKNGIGYKSLLEADPNKPAAEVPPSPAAPEPPKAEGKGFFHSIGRFFKGKKDTTQP
jgi:predicted alpha/beta superfamily hydrolase